MPETRFDNKHAAAASSSSSTSMTMIPRDTPVTQLSPVDFPTHDKGSCVVVGRTIQFQQRGQYYQFNLDTKETKAAAPTSKGEQAFLRKYSLEEKIQVSRMEDVDVHTVLAKRMTERTLQLSDNVFAGITQYSRRRSSPNPSLWIYDRERNIFSVCEVNNKSIKEFLFVKIGFLVLYDDGSITFASYIKDRAAVGMVSNSPYLLEDEQVIHIETTSNDNHYWQLTASNQLIFSVHDPLCSGGVFQNINLKTIPNVTNFVLIDGMVFYYTPISFETMNSLQIPCISVLDAATLQPLPLPNNMPAHNSAEEAVDPIQQLLTITDAAGRNSLVILRANSVHTVPVMHPRAKLIKDAMKDNGTIYSIVHQYLFQSSPEVHLTRYGSSADGIQMLVDGRNRLTPATQAWLTQYSEEAEARNIVLFLYLLASFPDLPAIKCFDMLSYSSGLERTIYARVGDWRDINQGIIEFENQNDFHSAFILLDDCIEACRDHAGADPMELCLQTQKCLLAIKVDELEVVRHTKQYIEQHRNLMPDLVRFFLSVIQRFETIMPAMTTTQFMQHCWEQDFPCRTILGRSRLGNQIQKIMQDAGFVKEEKRAIQSNSRSSTSSAPSAAPSTQLMLRGPAWLKMWAKEKEKETPVMITIPIARPGPCVER